MFGDKPRSLPQRIALILIPEFTMMPVTSAIEPLRLANRQAEKELYVWTMHSADGLPVKRIERAQIMADGDFDAIPEHAPGCSAAGSTSSTMMDRRLIDWLRGRRDAAPISARCAPVRTSWPRPAARRLSLHHPLGEPAGFRRGLSEIDITGSLFEIDRDRFTSAGGTSALDMMLALIASQHGPELAAAVAEKVLHSPIRHHSEHQRMSLPARIGARHPKLVGIIEQMEQNLEEPLSPSLLAKRAGLSTRQLERLFRRYLDRSPKRYYLELRLKKARSLLLQTEMSVINVALACGFSSPSHFSKCYRAFYGRTPYRERGLPALETGAAA